MSRFVALRTLWWGHKMQRMLVTQWHQDFLSLFLSLALFCLLLSLCCSPTLSFCGTSALKWFAGVCLIFFFFFHILKIWYIYNTNSVLFFLLWPHPSIMNRIINNWNFKTTNSETMTHMTNYLFEWHIRCATLIFQYNIK